MAEDKITEEGIGIVSKMLSAYIMNMNNELLNLNDSLIPKSKKKSQGNIKNLFMLISCQKMKI